MHGKPDIAAHANLACHAHVLPKQDHVVAGVRLTKRDTFLRRSEFMQLVYAACSPARPGLTDQADIACPPPAILKPHALWTGKQARMRPSCQPSVLRTGALCGVLPP